MNGQGFYKWGNGKEFEGTFKDNLIDGYGKCSDQDGTCYVGEWQGGV